MNTIRKTKAGYILEMDGVSAYYDAIVQGARVLKAWISSERYDRIAKRLAGTYLDCGEEVTITPDDPESLLQHPDAIDCLLGEGEAHWSFPRHAGEVRYLEDRTID